MPQKGNSQKTSVYSIIFNAIKMVLKVTQLMKDRCHRRKFLKKNSFFQE